MSFRPLHGWLLALSEFGWLLPLVISLFLLSQYFHEVRTIPKGALPGDTTIKTIAREPGVGFDTLLFCNDPATRVHGPTLPVPEDAGRLIAERGLEIVNWPGQGSIAAMHFYTDSQGINKSEPVEMTPASAACFEKKAKR